MTTEPQPTAPAGRKAWAKAFAAAQAAFKTVTKDKEVTVKTNQGGSFTYKYADLSAVHEAVIEALTTNGMSYAQDVTGRDHTIEVSTRIYHEGGWVETFGPLPLPSGQTAQQAGGSITYARRYALCAALGIAADEDTDAQGVETPSLPERRRGTKPEKVKQREREMLDQAKDATLRDAIAQVQEDKPKPNELGPAAIAGARRVVEALITEGASDDNAKAAVRAMITPDTTPWTWSDLAQIKVQDEVLDLARTWLVRAAVEEAEGA